MPTADRSRTASSCAIGWLQGISLGGVSSINGDSGTRHLAVGIIESLTEGSPNAPSLCIAQPGFWRFRWGVKSGTHTIQILVKQNPANAYGLYPSMIVRANPSIGVNADITSVSPGGTAWVTIGPISVIPSSSGLLWVELHNNDRDTYDATNGNITPSNPAFFDHIIIT